MDEKILGLMVEFFYTSMVEINEENVQDLLAVASLLQVQSVVDACCEFLRRQLTDENCLGKSRRCLVLLINYYCFDGYYCTDMYWRLLYITTGSLDKSFQCAVVPIVVSRLLKQCCSRRKMSGWQRS